MPKITNWERSAWNPKQGAAWSHNTNGRIDIMKTGYGYRVKIMSMGGHPDANVLESEHNEWKDAVSKARKVAKKHPNGL